MHVMWFNNATHDCCHSGSPDTNTALQLLLEIFSKSLNVVFSILGKSSKMTSVVESHVKVMKFTVNSFGICRSQNCEFYLMTSFASFQV